MKDEYIRKQDAIDAIHCDIKITGRENAETVCKTIESFTDGIKSLEPADVAPYSVSPDGTLIITVPKGTTANRVLVEWEGTHCGGLYYAD